MSLEKYNSKRDFSRTSEPKGIRKKNSRKFMFVVQHHYSRREHYDIRFLYKGELVSFACPKGPSLSTKDKRLAVKVENHPVSYADFEGIIPKGEYGAGTVILWDKGYYTFRENSNFDSDVVKFTFYGERLHGDYTLVRFKEDNWLLIKDRDKYSSNVKKLKYDTSIKSGKTKKEIEMDSFNTVELTHGDKVIFKKNKITKRDIFNYYKEVYPRMEKFFDNRLITTVRCPDGDISNKFFMKHLNNSKLGVKRVKSLIGTDNKYYYVKDLEGLLSEVQMNSYEFHMWGSRARKLNKPDIMVFDFDPDERLSIKKVRDGVKDLKRILDRFNLKGFVKTSGGKGYHVFVPINVNSFKVLENISHQIASLMEANFPKKYTLNIRKEKREGKIFIDYFRNKKGATSVMPYSVRLNEKASISCPIKWSEIDTIKPDEITILNVKDRLKRKDPWEDFFDNSI